MGIGRGIGKNRDVPVTAEHEQACPAQQLQCGLQVGTADNLSLFARLLAATVTLSLIDRLARP